MYISKVLHTFTKNSWNKLLFFKRGFFVHPSAKSEKSQVLDSCDDYKKISNKNKTMESAFS